MQESTKLYDLLESIVREVGETTAEPYPTHRSPHPWDRKSVQYLWSSEDEVPYVMYIFKEKDDTENGGGTYTYMITFGVRTGRRVDYDVTNKTGQTGNMWRTMATVVKSIKDEIKLDEESGVSVTTIAMSPTKREAGDERRTKLYTSYIRKNIPDSKIEYDDVDDGFIKVRMPVKKQTQDE